MQFTPRLILAFLLLFSGSAGAIDDPIFKDGFEPPLALQITSNAGNGVHQLGNQLITFTFAEGVSGFEESDISITGALAGAFKPVSDTVYTLSLTGLGGTVTVSVPDGAAASSTSGTPTAKGDFSNFYQDTPQINLPGGVALQLVRIPAGTFDMGSPEDELSRFSDEEQHEVTLSRDYYMGVTEVTQAQWLAAMGSFPQAQSHGSDDDLAVHNVSWDDIMDPATGFMKLLNDHITSTGQPFEVKLPTEARWEYAARAGTTTRFSFGDGFAADEICATGGGREDNMWYCGNTGSSTQLVKQKPANPWGLYDMHGNVDEWCADWIADYPVGSVLDPVGPATGSSRVFRGGNWGSGARSTRSAARNATPPGNRSFTRGFRIAASRPATLGISSNRPDVHRDTTQQLSFTLTGGGFASFNGSEIQVTGATKGNFGPFNPPSSIFYLLDLQNIDGGTVTVNIPEGAAIPFPPYTTSAAASFSNFYQDILTVQLPDLDSEDVTMEFIRIPAGTFTQGAPDSETSKGFEETPQFEVTISEEFYMSRTEVTQDQWESVRSLGSFAAFPAAQSFVGGSLPVHNVSSDDIFNGGSAADSGFVFYLNAVLGNSGLGNWTATLPTESQWEYAARAGTTTRFSFGDGFSTDENCATGGGRGEHMWFCGNAGSAPHDVGQKLPNPWGLYDIYGNVAEWTQTGFYFYPDGAVTSTGIVVRGGHYSSQARAARSAARSSLTRTDRTSSTGLRVVLLQD
jgi:formylglycine-generating enzyme required for sulfatase activity